MYNNRRPGRSVNYALPNNNNTNAVAAPKKDSLFDERLESNLMSNKIKQKIREIDSPRGTSGGYQGGYQSRPRAGFGGGARPAGGFGGGRPSYGNRAGGYQSARPQLLPPTSFGSKKEYFKYRAQAEGKYVPTEEDNTPRVKKTSKEVLQENETKYGKYGIDTRKYVQKAKVVEEAKYVSTHTFKDFKLPELLDANLEKLGFVHPSPIQDKTIPAGILGKDIFGIAETGTGKTAAFLLPMISQMITSKKKGLVLAPTRELAMQIEKDFRNMTTGMQLWTLAIIGGMSMRSQISRAMGNYDIVIGTPGRVKDLMQKGFLKLDNIEMVVLDEADRMLDMGFRDDIRTILNQTAQAKQTFFFSATITPEIENLSKAYLREPLRISVKTQDTAKNVDQDIVKVMSGENKVDKLHDLLIQPGFSKTIVFCKTKRRVEAMNKELAERGFKTVSIHGDMFQAERNRAITAFKEGEKNVLIATDVAARGIHIDDVSHVINFDIPENYEDYVHRIGRTGRAGKKGFALTFV